MNQYNAGWSVKELEILTRHFKPNRNAWQIFLDCKKDGIVRTFNSVESKVKHLKRDAYRGNLDKPFRVGYLDIESTSLDAFGEILTWCIKERDGEIEYDMVTRDELINYRYDKRVVTSLVQAMFRYNQLFTFYGGDYHFDIPMIRSKAVELGVEFPAHGQMFHVDVWGICKKKLRMRRNSLDAVCNYFGIEGKTHLDNKIWKRAKYGCRKSLVYILEHNKADVIILEKLHKKLETFTPSGKASI